MYGVNLTFNCSIIQRLYDLVKIINRSYMENRNIFETYVITHYVYTIDIWE